MPRVKYSKLLIHYAPWGAWRDHFRTSLNGPEPPLSLTKRENTQTLSLSLSRDTTTLLSHIYIYSLSQGLFEISLRGHEGLASIKPRYHSLSPLSIFMYKCVCVSSSLSLSLSLSKQRLCVSVCLCVCALHALYIFNL